MFKKVRTDMQHLFLLSTLCLIWCI